MKLKKYLNQWNHAMREAQEPHDHKIRWTSKSGRTGLSSILVGKIEGEGLVKDWNENPLEDGMTYSLEKDGD